ncbi:putative Uridine/cytidine kinase [Viridothelium virens]|uniref:Putative Uridine/cytidine kinase n=1 Tax=Viridothelium virens TaxID=1048519 RepID=A0A6A6GXV5_VIRVR|nr:putative Uridine/cytidine kinase [Viridothelium virens]
MSVIVDDKSDHCIPFILKCLDQHKSSHPDGEDSPFFLGLNGVQGAGKTTLVSTLHKTLTSPPYNLRTAILSIDDIYLTHADQVALARSNPDNPLIQHRGEPGTHDLQLGISLFSSLKNRNPTKIPAYDKSAFNGQGDRAPEPTWETVNTPGTSSISVVIFEGWCVGFRALSSSALESKWSSAVEAARSSDYQGRLGKHELSHVAFVNERLRGYDGLTDMLDAFIHIDAEDTQFVYRWRLEQEAKMRAEKGSGMSDEGVVEFVNGYYPAYELYTDTLREGIFKEKGRQLRLVVGQDRKVKTVETL